MNNSSANSRNQNGAAQPPSAAPQKNVAQPPSAASVSASLRRSVYALLILVSLGAMLGRILAVDSVDKVGLEDYRVKKLDSEMAAKRGQLESRGISGAALDEQLAQFKTRWLEQARLRRPFLSANDRSRWCTVRALVESDMRVEGAPYAIDKVIQKVNWDTIDMVKHDGHLYSSKPELLPTLMAAVYWPIHRFGGFSLGDRPYEIGRLMLVLFNLIPLAIYFVLLAALVERFGVTDWGRIFVMAAACFGTFLTTFVIAINNHLPAAVCAVAAIYAAVRIWFDGERRMRFFLLAGLFGGFMAANELPALSLLAVIGIVLLWKAPKPTLLAFTPAVLLVAAAFLGTNWIAHHSLVPAYMHNQGGGSENWYEYTYQRNGQTHDSYWSKKNPPKGIDAGEAEEKVYVQNFFVGHHGVFSLTPVWIMSLIGLVLWIFRRGDARLRWAAGAMFAVSAAVMAFYLSLPPWQRNYGGSTCGLRWLFWLAPLWLLAMLPAADLLASRRWSRGLGLVLLALSALSASYPTWNPWTNPWLMVLSHYMGWGQ